MHGTSHAAPASLKHRQHNAIEDSICDYITTLAIPSYFFVGRFDYSTPYELIILFVKRLDAPLKELV